MVFERVYLHRVVLGGRRNGRAARKQAGWFEAAIEAAAPEIDRTFGSAVERLADVERPTRVEAVDRSHDVRRAFGTLARAAAAVQLNAAVQESWRRMFAPVDTRPAEVPACLAGPRHSTRRRPS